jgi:hypothetical protein
MGTEAISPGIKQQGREADQIPPSNAEDKNGEASTPHTFHDVVLN